MKIQNSPASYGFLAGALVLLLALLANACAHSPLPPTDDAMQPVRPPEDSAVAIYTECGSGSGVLLNGRQVLTAFHVINCAEFPEVGVAKVIVVRTFRGTAHVVVNAALDPGRDIARLDLDTLIPDVAPVRIRQALIGEPICAVSVVPERSRPCGHVEEFSGPRSHGDVKVREANYWFGNSGSGVYGADGALVGILVRLNWCTTGDAFLWALTDTRPETTCGGRISSITDSIVRP